MVSEEKRIYGTRRNETSLNFVYHSYEEQNSIIILINYQFSQRDIFSRTTGEN